MGKLFGEMRRYWMENVILCGGWRQRMGSGGTGAMWTRIRTVLTFRMAGHLRLALLMVV